MASIHSEDVVANILSSVQSIVLVSVALQQLGSSFGLVDGSPAEHHVPAFGIEDVIVVDLISVQGRLVHVGLIVGQGVAQFVVSLVAAIVTQSNGQLVAQTGDIHGHAPGAVLVLDHIFVTVVLVELRTALVHQNSSSGVLIGEGNGQVVAAIDSALLDGIGIQHGSGQVDVDGHLVEQNVGLGILNVDSAVDGQVDHIAVLQVGEVVQIVIVPAIDQGNHSTVGGGEHGLGVLLQQLVMHDLACFVGVDDLHLTGVTHQGQVHIGDLVGSAVTVGGQNVVIGIVGANAENLAVFVSFNGAHVGVQAQHPVVGSIAQAGPQHVVVLVAGDLGAGDFPHTSLIPEAGVEQGSLVPTLVEAQEGQAQGDFVLAFQVDVAFHIVAAGEVGVDPFLVSIGQLDGDSDFLAAACSDSNSVLAEGHAGVIQSAVFLCQEVNAGVCSVQLVVFAQQAGTQGVGLSLVGEVVHGEGEGELTLLAVAQLSLGASGTGNGQVSLSSHSAQSVHQASTLLTGRGLYTSILVDDGFGSAHDQCVAQLTNLSLGCVGEGQLDVLQDQCGDTGDLRTSHGGTTHQAVSAAIQSGVNVTADTGQVRYQTHITGGAPAREGADLAAGSDVLTEGVVAVEDQSLLLCVSHLLAVGQGDQTYGDLRNNLIAHLVDNGSSHAEHEDVAVIGIPDDTAYGACVLRIHSLTAELDGATLDHSDLAVDDAVAFFIIEVSFLAQAVNDHVLQLAHAIQVSHGNGNIAIHVLDRVLIEDLGAISQGKVVSSNNLVVHAGDTHGVGVSGGRSNGTVVDVIGGHLVVTPVGTGVTAAFVTDSDVNDHIALSDTAENSVSFLITGDREATGNAQGHVDNVNAQLHAVFQCSDNGVHTCTAAGAEDLHGEDLCIGSHTADIGAFHSVGSCDTSNVGTMVAQGVVMGDVGGAGSIVEGEGDLSAVEQVLAGDGFTGLCRIQLFQIQIILIQDSLQTLCIPGSACGSSCEGGMVNVQTGIQNGNGHALAGVAQILPDLCDVGHIGSGNGVGSHGLLLGRHNFPLGVQENVLNAGNGSDLLQVAELGADHDSVGQVVGLAHQLSIACYLLNSSQHIVLLCDHSVGNISGNIHDRAVGLSSGCILQHHECSDLGGGLQLTRQLAQHLNVAGQLSVGQFDNLAVCQNGRPLAVLQAQGVIMILQVALVISQAVKAKELARRSNQILEPARVATGCAVLTGNVHCICSRCNTAQNKAEHQQHGDPSFHVHTLSSIFYAPLYVQGTSFADESSISQN